MDHCSVLSERRTGSIIVNTVSFPGSDEKVILPPEVMMMLLTIARPSPIPPDLVVKFGWKILSDCSGEIPDPLSEMIMR